MNEKYQTLAGALMSDQEISRVSGGDDICVVLPSHCAVDGRIIPDDEIRGPGCPTPPTSSPVFGVS